MRILQVLTVVTVLGTSVPFGLAQDASSFRTLYSLTGQLDAGSPLAGVAIGTGGLVYGTTSGGGASNAGTVFSLKAPIAPGGAWTQTVLYSFTGGNDGTGPAGLAIGKSGVLYGTTSGGGTSNAGTAFSLTPPKAPGGSWTQAVLYSFTGGNDGAGPAGLAIGTSGELYGTTSGGGTPNAGTVFSLKAPTAPGGSWTQTVLYSFTGGNDGTGPAGVAIGKGNVLYGATSGGGTSNAGTVFSLTPPTAPGGAWTQAVLYSFTGGNDGAGPAGVAIGTSGVLYGTTSGGGTPNAGTVFSLTGPTVPGGAWTQTVLYSFTGGNDGTGPAGVAIGKGHVLYGATSGGGASNAGTVFSLTPPKVAGGAWTQAVLYSFTGGSNGG